MAVTGIAKPSGRPNVMPGPRTPGTSAGLALGAMLDNLGSLAVGRLPGLEASRIALEPAGTEFISQGIDHQQPPYQRIADAQ